MASALYRKSSGEVVKISHMDSTFPRHDSFYFGVMSNINAPDGMEFRERLGDGTLGPYKVFGFAKFADVATNTVRNATIQEIDTFVTEEDSDKDSQLAENAENVLIRHPVFKKIFEALVEEVDNPGPTRVDGIKNRLRGRRPRP
jgi:hypothetical protein